MHKLQMTQLDVSQKKILLRVDYNVPMKDGQIADDMRIQATLPTIKYLIDKGAGVILMSHMGRPKGKKDLALSLQVCAKRLGEHLKKGVVFVDDCIGSKVKKAIDALPQGGVLLLENLRFYSAEEKPESDPHFAKELASFGDLYVNDAFAVSHRKHASVYEVPKLFKQAAAGLLMEKEIEFLSEKVLDPKRPFYAILGGAKISTKLGVVKALLDKVDGLMIGGAMAYTFFKAQGKKVGQSLVENDFVAAAKEILDSGRPCFLPVDVLAAKVGTTEVQIVSEIEEGYEGVSIGPKTVEAWKRQLQEAKTVFWNGPLGIFENEAFARATFQMAEIVAHLNATTIAGGGDVVAAINQSGFANQFSHLSTGGGASLELIEFGTLPGIEVLTNNFN
jgi:phosphoglycerate kinase